MSTTEFTFLVCSERSGSNLIASLMNGHSALSAPPPTHMFRLFGTNAPNYGDLERQDNWNILLNDIVTAFRNQIGVWNTAPTIESLQAQTAIRTVAAPLKEIYRAEARHDNAEQVFVKENHTARFADFLLEHFDLCRFVFMVREPRDVAASYLSTDSIPGGIGRAVGVWKRDQEENLLLQSKLSASGRLHFLRYEDLIAHPAYELQRIASFLGLDFQPNMLKSYRDSRVRRNADRTAAWENLRKPILADNAGKFQRTLRHAEIEYVELCCFELMQSFNYQPQIVSKHPDEAYRSRRIAELTPMLRHGRYLLDSEEEQDVRQLRLAIIETVTSRKLR